jgi:hypothetical protein
MEEFYKLKITLKHPPGKVIKIISYGEFNHQKAGQKLFWSLTLPQGRKAEVPVDNVAMIEEIMERVE